VIDPLVSVVIPAYKPTYLARAIESALNQTHRSTEIVVSDNCPDEGVRLFVERYPAIRYVRNPTTGVYSNFRNCIRLARGEFVKFLLDDDELANRCIEVLVDGFEEYPDATLAASAYRVIDAKDRELELRQLHTDKVVSSPGGAAPHMLMSARNPIGPLTTSMFRRKHLPLGLGPWFFHTGAPERYFGLIDMTIILDLAFQGRVVMYPEPLSAMRSHPEQLSNPAVNPKLIHTLTSWRALAEDAYAFGLISQTQLVTALQAARGLYRRFVAMFPELAREIAQLESELRNADSVRS
jgi:hypothetical protein